MANPNNFVAYAKAAIALHKCLRDTECMVYCPAGFVDGEDGEGNIIRGRWRDDEGTLGLQTVGMTSSIDLHCWQTQLQKATVEFSV